MKKIIESWDEIGSDEAVNLYTISRPTPPWLGLQAANLVRKQVDFTQVDPSLADIQSADSDLLPLSMDIFSNFGSFQNTFDSQAELKIQSHHENSCMLFHYDSVKVRMIITYYGPGTEDVDNENVNWEKLGTTWNTFEEYNCRVLKNRSKVNILNNYDIHILFGDKDRKLPRIHRAPDIESTNQKRFTMIGTIY